MRCNNGTDVVVTGHVVTATIWCPNETAAKALGGALERVVDRWCEEYVDDEDEGVDLAAEAQAQPAPVVDTDAIVQAAACLGTAERARLIAELKTRLEPK